VTEIAFDQSQGHHYLWGWPGRAECVASIAERLRAFAALLADVDPAYRDLRLLERRARPPDPGPLIDLAVDDLAAMIDRWTRFDPPQRPKPVSGAGYSMVIGNLRRPSDHLYISFTAHVSASAPASANAVRIELNPNGPGWQDDAVMRRVFEGGLGIWGAEWGAVWHSRYDREPVRRWPRLAWTQDGFASHSIPPYWHEFPFPFPFKRQPKARKVHPDLGGELEEWAWPPRLRSRSL